MRCRPGRAAEVRLLTPRVRRPDLVDHGQPLHRPRPRRRAARRARAFAPAVMAVGSLGGLAAAQARRVRPRADPSPRPRRPASTTRRFLAPGLGAGAGLAPHAGLRVPRGRCALRGRAPAEEAVAAALADPDCLMVNRNAGAGTRILIDGLLGGARPDGLLEPAALAQRRRRRGRPGAGRLGRGDRARRPRLRPRLPGPGRGALRFRAGRGPARAAGGGGLPGAPARPVLRLTPRGARVHLGSLRTRKGAARATPLPGSTLVRKVTSRNRPGNRSRKPERRSRRREAVAIGRVAVPVAVGRRRAGGDARADDAERRARREASTDATPAITTAEAATVARAVSAPVAVAATVAAVLDALGRRAARRAWESPRWPGRGAAGCAERQPADHLRPAGGTGARGAARHAT